jgi:hypothetical protein
MRTLLPAILALALPLSAQLRPIPIFPEELRQFLDLKNDQVAAIVRLNGEYTELAGRQQLRTFQVQAEISEELRKETLDPGAIGIRYAEIEAIRRDLEAQLKKTRQQAQAQLTDAQKAKVKVLEDARKLQTMIGQAECTNLLDPLQGNVIPAARISAFLVGFVPTYPCSIPLELGFVAAQPTASH